MRCAKVGYERRRFAHQAAKRLKLNTGTRGVRPYACPACGLWHVGHLPAATKAGVLSSDAVYGR